MLETETIPSKNAVDPEMRLRPSKRGLETKTDLETKTNLEYNNTSMLCAYMCRKGLTWSKSNFSMGTSIYLSKGYHHPYSLQTPQHNLIFT